MLTADHALLGRWISHGDAEAFAELVRRHGGMVHAVCRRIVTDRALADDLSQECFLSLAQTDARSGRSLAGWLHRVATNRALSALRARRPEVALDPVADETAMPDRLAAWREVEVRVDAAIVALPEEQRSVVVGVERSVLAVWLGALPCEAAPPVVLASLGKIAVAGPGVATAATTVVATIGTAKATVVGMSAVVLIAIATTFVAMRSSGARADLPNVQPASPRVAAARETEADRRQVPARSEVPTSETERPSLEIAHVTGVVRTVDGQPVVGADVVLVELPDGDSFRYLESDQLQAGRVRRTTSDSLGRFEIERRDPARPAWASAFSEGMVGRRQRVPARGGDESAAELVLELAAGRTLRGRVSGPDGAVLPGAVVSVAQCWTADDYGEGSGFTLTDERGEFAVGVDEDAVACTLRVNASQHGQDLHRGVPVDVFAELRWQPRAMLRGRVAGMTAERVGTVAVAARGSLPDPPVPVMRSGLRPELVFEASVGADGTFTVSGLQPGLSYAAVMIGVLQGQPARGRRAPRLSPDTYDRFTPEPGEIVERDFSLAAPIVVRGHVTTATSRRAVEGARIEVSKGGATFWDAFVQTGEAGAFELSLVAGDGVYTLRALPPWWVGRDAPGPAAIERRLIAGEIVEVDFELPEPIVIPFRVVDARGEPVESVRTTLTVTTVDGRHASIGDSRRLDVGGRSQFELFDAIASARVEIQRFPQGPRSTVEIEGLTPGVRIVERTIALPDTCAVVGFVQDADGLPLAESTVTIVARYDDGATDDCTTRTDRDGRFAVSAAFRSERATFTLRVDSRRAASVAGAPSSGGGIDLGVVVVQ